MNEIQILVTQKDKDRGFASYRHEGNLRRILIGDKARVGDTFHVPLASTVKFNDWDENAETQGINSPTETTKQLDTGETDPTGKGAGEAGAKLDAGKPDLSLLVMFGRALSAVGGVGTFGAKKYTRGGWQDVPDGETRYTAAMLRHLFAEDENAVDSDSGCLHAAQVAWNSLARLELYLRRKEEEENDAKENSD